MKMDFRIDLIPTDQVHDFLKSSAPVVKCLLDACFVVYKVLSYVLSHFILTTVLDDKKGKQCYSLLTK